MRKIRDTDLVGKTVKSMDVSDINVVRLTFADDTVLDVWAENVIHTYAGSIPGIFVDDVQLPKKD
jgi:hypothetical protein